MSPEANAVVTDRYEAPAALPLEGGYPTDWFSLIRWYGPTQAFFDRKYKPGDFVKVDG
jgi:hypothetical protein